MQICEKLLSYQAQDGALLGQLNQGRLQVIFVKPDIVRVRVGFGPVLEDASYCLMTTAWPDRLDKLFEGERVRLAPCAFELSDEGGALILRTSKLCLRIQKEPLRVSLYDERGTLLFQTIEGSSFLKDSNGRVMCRSEMDEEDAFYGFGEKGGPLNKNKAFLRLRATDAMGYDAVKMDGLYKHIPFYIHMPERTQTPVGVFFHNFYESVFSLGNEKSNYWHRYSYWQADGGDIDLFLLGGGSIKQVVDRYTLLTGRPALLPKRALGYQGSSMYYPELPKNADEAVLQFVRTAKEEGFPIDGFHLSSGYTSYQNRRCVFHWNLERFPDPAGYFAKMNEEGAQNVPNIKPGILLCHPKFEDFDRAGVFVRDAGDPQTYAKGVWWGGIGAFFDFTNPIARDVWKQHMKDALIKVGTNSIWNDNCEYDSVLDKDALCDYDGKGGTLAELKPLMSLIMCKLSNDAVCENDADARPYSVCRSGSAGIQRYAQTWCGDNCTSWESLKYNVPMILGMGLSGQPHEGADIGGFAGPRPEEELFVRWVQQGIFQPRFSIHSASNDNTVTEPWMYERQTPLIREAMLLRYRLMPYLYSAMYQATQTGEPIMRPLVFDFEHDRRVWDESFLYMFGRAVLVANVLEKGQTEKEVYLPQGAAWYRLDDDCLTAYQGGQTVTLPVSLSTVPMFLREGQVLVMAQNQLMSMERDKAEGLSFILAKGAEDIQYTLYEDDGISNRYRRGVYRKTHLTVTGDKVVSLAFGHEGTYQDSVKTLAVTLINKARSPFWVSLGKEKLPQYLNRRLFDKARTGWYYSQTKGAVEIKCMKPEQDFALTVSFEDFDLIGM